LFSIHGKPVVGNLQSKVTIANGRLFEPFLQSLRAGRGNVMLHGVLNEATALPRPYHAVNGADRIFRQDDIDASGHGIAI
jgi:hypothetical protein